jgi:drug/metabolite transporter (DMT)-like permease
MNNKLTSWLIFILLCLIWGSSFILMKVSQEGLTAPQIAALRIGSAALVFLPFALVHFRQLPASRLGTIALTGLFGNFLPAFCFAIAILHMDSSLAGILNSLTPLCVALIAIIFFKEKIKPKKLLGILVGFAGLCLLTFTQKNISLNNIGYSGLILIGTISYGINVNLVGHYLKGLNPVKVATVSLSFMLIPSLLVLWQQGFFSIGFSDPVVQWSVLNSALLGVVGSAIATVLFYMLVQKAGGLFASLVTYGIPFVALGWGFYYGEAITVMIMISLAIILLGVYLGSRQ